MITGSLSQELYLSLNLYAESHEPEKKFVQGLDDNTLEVLHLDMSKFRLPKILILLIASLKISLWEISEAKI
ncbi:hypothetical protein K1719_039146 [Acacia pycnantha]|nr:hypothetical protein K1719_039146 [Acacia pycnantha]